MSLIFKKTFLGLEQQNRFKKLLIILKCKILLLKKKIILDDYYNAILYCYGFGILHPVLIHLYM